MNDQPHNAWEARYQASSGYLFGSAPARFLSDNPWLLIPGARALCVADGEGRNSVFLAQAGLHVSAFDVSPTAVQRARHLASESAVRVDSHICAWEEWDWHRPFDLVVAIFIQFADPEFRARQFANMTQALVPGGRLALHGYSVDQLAHGTGGPRDQAHLYTDALLRTQFAGWQIERCASYEAELQEGPAHSGRSALVDFVATRPVG